MYKKILVPLGGPTLDDRLLRHVADLALAVGAEVLLLRVAHYHTRDAQAHEVEEAQEYLEHAQAKMEADGVRATTIVRHGEPVQEIVSLAESSGADLIAMGTHGHSELKHLLVGSVAEGVLRATTIPVLFVKPHGTA
ncbi:MAG: universal stress protein [Chloroflexota bacterium]|nr:MAG: universal stress protein [Chloroflexota bacterium]